MFGIAILASTFGSLIGRASSITMSTLILLSVPPHTAIAADHFGIIGGGFYGTMTGTFPMYIPLFAWF
jgi:hypothetical protein